MPTRHRRHTVTETPPVARALRRLEALDPEGRVDLKELLVLGATEKAERLERSGGAASQRREALVEEFLALRADRGIDAEAALALHDAGWAREA